MDNAKLFQIAGPNISYLPNEGRIFDVLGNKGNELQNSIKQYKKLLDLSSKIGHQITQIILGGIGISFNTNQIKRIGNIAIQVRKILKDANPDIVQEIDKPSFIIPFIYLCLGFNADDIGHNGKGGMNSVQALAKTIQVLISTDIIIFSGFLCAQRAHDSVDKDGLVKDVNIGRFIHSTNILRGIAENLDKPYTMEFSHVQGDSYGMNAISPTIFMRHLLEGKLNQMSKVLDSQFEQMEKGAGPNVKILTVSDHFIHTKTTLDELYGNNWGIISDIEMESMLDLGDKIAEIAYHMTVSSLKRFGDLKEILEERYSEDKKDSLYAANNVHGGMEHIEPTIDMFFESKSLHGKALYETMFYYLWGVDAKKRNAIGIGFDRDHDIYQTSAFALGYNGKDPNTFNPLLYARRTGRQPGIDIKDLTFRQFWFYEGNDIPD